MLSEQTAGTGLIADCLQVVTLRHPGLTDLGHPVTGASFPSASWSKFPHHLTFLPLRSLLYPFLCSLPVPYPGFPPHFPSPSLSLFPSLFPKSSWGLDTSGVWGWALAEIEFGASKVKNLASGENNFSDVHKELYWLPPCLSPSTFIQSRRPCPVASFSQFLGSNLPLPSFSLLFPSLPRSATLTL